MLKNKYGPNTKNIKIKNRNIKAKSLYIISGS